MPQWQGRSKGTPLGYRIFIGILKRWGVSPAYFLLRFVAAYYFLFAWKSNRLTWYYFRKRLGLGWFPSFFKLYRNYYFFGQTIIDRVVLMSGIHNKFTFHFDGEEHLHEIARNGKGGLLLSAHIGNWEIAGHLLKRLQAPVNIVMFDGEHQRLKEYLTSVTGERSANIIVIKEDLSHIYGIIDALSKNELVCMHADRFVEDNKIMEVVFLGKKAKFPSGPFVLATRLNVPVSFVFAMKEKKYHYHFFASEAKEYTGDDKILLQQDVLSDFVNGMEKKVKAYPEQWYNYYPFWK